MAQYTPDGTLTLGSATQTPHYAHRGHHPVLMWVRTGVKRNGAITALHFKTVDTRCNYYNQIYW